MKAEWSIDPGRFECSLPRLLHVTDGLTLLCSLKVTEDVFIFAGLVSNSVEDVQRRIGHWDSDGLLGLGFGDPDNAGVEVALIPTETEDIFRGTAIRQQSDIDLLVVMDPAEVLWAGKAISSVTLLNRLRAELLDRFPNTSLGRDGEAVVVPFADGRYPIDVVPGFLAKGDGTIKSYGIPSTDGGWKATAPDAHKNFVMRENLTSGAKLSQTARMLKFWRCCRTPEVPISSFHVELLLASEKICIPKYSIAECFFLALKALAARDCRGLRDPLGIAGLVTACSTDAQRESALRAVNFSLGHADAALRAMYSGIREESMRQWDIVFNGCFPKS